MGTTMLTENDEVVTITYALPSVLALINHIQNSRRHVKYCGTVSDIPVTIVTGGFQARTEDGTVP